MFRVFYLITVVCFLIWIMPFGIFLETVRANDVPDHSAPSGCLCSGASGKTAQYTKYILQDACRGKPLSKFGGAAHNDLFVFTDRGEIMAGSTAFTFHYSFLYDFHIVPLVEHVPKTTRS
ncbi:MAG: hypothetical protein AB7S78_13305 [Candidatus Omnitrophota bacterium]